MIFSDVTCLGCGCACDDIRITVRDSRIVEAARACELGASWFGDGSLPAEAAIDGVRAPILSHDNVADLQKMIAVVPEAASVVEGRMRLVTSEGISDSIEVIVEQNGGSRGPAGPGSPVGNRAVDDGPPTYPPISNQ